ncbi:glycoside hydrolase family 10 protein, partial [Nostoc sp. NIES-2111]
MTRKKKEPSGCGCLNIPLSVIIVVLGGGYWWFSQKGFSEISKFLPQNERITTAISPPTPTPSATPTSSLSKP